MAQKYITQVLDDLDGKVLEDGQFKTVRIGFNGQNYALDLSEKHVAELEKDLDKYLSKARKDTGAPAMNTRSSTKRKPSEDLAAIRAWANSNGYTVAERGRIPVGVMEAYEAAH